MAEVRKASATLTVSVTVVKRCAVAATPEGPAVDCGQQPPPPYRVEISPVVLPGGIPGKVQTINF